MQFLKRYIKQKRTCTRKWALKRGPSEVCELWSATETSQTRRETGMWLLENDDLLREKNSLLMRLS